MAILRSHGILLVDAIPTHTPTAQQARLARLEDTLTLYYYNGTSWVTVDLDAVASIDPDGNDTPIVRGDAVTGVAPTAGEVTSPVSGDTASVFLTDGQLEKWSYNGTAWSLAYTLAANEAANLSTSVDATTVTVESSSGTDAVIGAATATDAGVMTAALFQDLLDLITLSGVSGNSQDLGTFTGTTIADGQTIKQAIQILETAIEAGAFSVTNTNSVNLTKTGDAISADVNISATQNGASVSILADGISVSVDAEAEPQAFDSAADALVALGAGAKFQYTAANLDGAVEGTVAWT